MPASAPPTSLAGAMDALVEVGLGRGLVTAPLVRALGPVSSPGPLAATSSASPQDTISRRTSASLAVSLLIIATMNDSALPPMSGILTETSPSIV